MRPAILIAALIAAPAFGQGADAARYASCLGLAATDAARAVDAAGIWRIEGGGIPARHCLGVAQARLGRYGAAAETLAGAAREADAAGQAPAGALYGQAANAALAADDAVTALPLLDRAVALVAAGPERGALHVDRAGEARAELDAAVRLAPADVDAWLLRATLARGEQRLDDAEASIAEAVRLAPDNTDVARERDAIRAVRAPADR